MTVRTTLHFRFAHPTCPYYCTFTYRPHFPLPYLLTANVFHLPKHQHIRLPVMQAINRHPCWLWLMPHSRLKCCCGLPATAACTQDISVRAEFCLVYVA